MKAPAWLTPGVGGVGAASFFSDTGHEITTAILPSFFTSVLHASAGALGLVEGISDSFMGLTKLAAGPLANQPQRRGRLASGGYLGTAVATGLIGVAVAVWQVGMLRAPAWTAARGRPGYLDRHPARSLHRRRARAICRVAITVSVRAAGGSLSTARAVGLDVGVLRRAGLLRFMVPVAAFELGNVATTLLILRATQELQAGGRSANAAAALAILIYAAHNALGAMGALAGGHWIDRAGPRSIFVVAAGLYVLTYAGFALPGQGWPVLLLAFTLAGSGIGLAETAESTLVARALPDELRGSGFGMLGAVQAAGDFGSSAIVGLLYAAVSPLVGFAYAAGWMAAAVLFSAALRVDQREREREREAVA